MNSPELAKVREGGANIAKHIRGRGRRRVRQNASAQAVAELQLEFGKVVHTDGLDTVLAHGGSGVEGDQGG